MSKLTIYLDGGAQFDITADSFKVIRNGLGQIHSMEWEGTVPRIMRLDVDKVIAVVEHPTDKRKKY